MPERQFALPDLGEGLTEGEILKWLVAAGDQVALDQPIVEVETAKAAVEIPSPYAGEVTAILVDEGATVEVGTPIISVAVAEAGGRTPVLVGYGPREGTATRRPRRAPADAEAPEPALPLLPTIPDDLRESAKPMRHGGLEVGRAVAAAADGATAPVLAKPPVRRLAKDLGVDLAAVQGTGPRGSITREDVSQAANGAAPVEEATSTANGERRIKVTGVRKLIAENMTRSAFTAPHVTEFLTVDATRTMKLVARLREQPEWSGRSVSPLLVLARAVLAVIPRYPTINSTWDDAHGEIVIKEYVNLGIAVAAERGLLVPNVKDAHTMSTRTLAGALSDLTGTARAGKSTPADLTGGTFTITNVGVFGVDAGTPILPPGEAAILAVGAIKQGPCVHRGKVRPRQVVTLALSFDHRIIDGEVGSLFLRDLGAFVTDPATSLFAWT